MSVHPIRPGLLWAPAPPPATPADSLADAYRFVQTVVEAFLDTTTDAEFVVSVGEAIDRHHHTVRAARGR